MGAAENNSRGADNGAARLIFTTDRIITAAAEGISSAFFLFLRQQQRGSGRTEAAAGVPPPAGCRSCASGGGADRRAEMAFSAALVLNDDLPAESCRGQQRRKRARKRAFLIASASGGAFLRLFPFLQRAAARIREAAAGISSASGADQGGQRPRRSFLRLRQHDLKCKFIGYIILTERLLHGFIIEKGGFKE